LISEGRGSGDAMPASVIVVAADVVVSFDDDVDDDDEVGVMIVAVSSRMYLPHRTVTLSSGLTAVNQTIFNVSYCFYLLKYLYLHVFIYLLLFI